VKAISIALALAMIGVVLCLWLFTGVRWYNFMAFMLVAQPLLLLAVVIFAVAIVRELKRTGVL
jgi:hypothetical protein